MSLEKVVAAVLITLCLPALAGAGLVWRADFDTGADGVVDLFDGNPNKVMIGPAAGGYLQITTWDSTGYYNGDKAGRPLGATLGGGHAFSGLYRFHWSALNTEQTLMWEAVGFLGNAPNQTRQICGAILRHWRIPDGRYWVAVDVAFGSVGLTQFGFNAGAPILLGTSPQGTPYQLAIGYDGSTHVLTLHLFSNAGTLLGGQTVDLDTDVLGLQGGATGDPAQEIGALAVTHLGWSDYTANGGDRATVWQVNSLSYFDTPDGAFLAAGGTPPVVGACCLGDGSCADARTESACSSSAGVWKGAGTICTAVNCEQGTGACCLPDDTCVEVTFGDCFGVWEGELTECATASCPPPWEDPNADEPWESVYDGLDTAADHVPNPLRWDRIIDDDWDEPNTSFRLNHPLPGYMSVDRVTNPGDHNRTGNIASRDPNFSNEYGITLEARVLIRENSQPDSFSMHYLDTSGSVGVQVSPGKVKVGELPPYGGGTVVNLDASDAFHLYRMVRMPHSYEVRLYRDNDPTPVAVGLGGPGFAVEPTGYLLFPQVLLGDNSNDPLYNASYVLDFVRYRRGATAPGQNPPTVPLRTLPPLPPPPASAETWTLGYDGIGYPSDAGWSQQGSASAWFQQVDGVMRLNTLGNNPAGAYRENPVPGWTNKAGITLEARMLVLPDSQERGFNLVLNDQVGAGTLLLSPDKVELSHAYLPGGFATVAMNTTTAFHVYRLTRHAYQAGTGQGLYWYLYIDDEPVAALADQKGAGWQLPYARVWFGDLAFPVPQNGCHVLIDYIRWHEGAAAPPRYADIDGDGDVDLADVDWFQACVHEPAESEPCIRADLDGDLDVGVQDWIRIETCLGGPEAAPPPGCAR